uniref:NADH-ubiquinone oxidoreductase chain 5 n=1 Tax=Ophiacantha linea TaxID=1357420 RepID=V9NK03_9ECHI|nr:NADH dehydrogenase subunit 5 [Ophiacantha linea]AGQ49785.1 NADH dehydrogenase subunit 5 [Ophiacantha linea]
MISLSLIFISFLSFLIFSFLSPQNENSNIATRLLMGLSLTAITFLTIWLILGCPQTVVNLSWFYSSLNIFSLSFFIDTSFIIFSSVALLVTWSIIEFSLYYMNSDPNIQSFLNSLILFLFFMMILTSSNNLFVLFIGWEGVGILSFVLISWWFTRADTNSASIQAIIYNRIGDNGFILFIIISILFLNTWQLSELIFLNPHFAINNWAILGIIIAAMGKSAQFGLHPWLPSAMEGPTPVSALLHSSTMVVAGVFLLYRCYPLLSTNSWSTLALGLIGSLTALFASSVALAQFDLKKVVAYSTTSQLGLMIVAISLGLPNLALFHICTHAFFKSLLFLCSGSVIHNLNNEQDLRKINGLPLPFTTSCIIIGNIALCGFPFLAGYYSKDLILEACQFNNLNVLIIILSLVATLITTLYSLRIVYYLLNANLNTNAISPINENISNLHNPLLRLIIGAITAGWIFSQINFNFNPIIIPLINKIIPLIFTIYSFIFIFDSLNNINTPNRSNIINYLSNTWFFVSITHGNSLNTIFSLSLKGTLRTLDQGWTTQISINNIINTTKTYTNWTQNIQNGNLTSYLINMSLISIGVLLYLI